MSKVSWKPGNMLYPLPAVMVTCTDGRGNDNVLTVAWTGTVCSEPPMLYISVRPNRHSHAMIVQTGEFVVNLTTEALVRETDYCGVKSGRDEDKFEATGLTRVPAGIVKAPLIQESPVNIECRVVKTISLGSHDMFIANVVNVNVSGEYMDKMGKFDLERAGLLAYSHGTYYGLGKQLGTFGYSVRKK